MRPWVLAGVLLVLAWPALAADQLSEARRLYNLAQYEKAEQVAREVISVPNRADAARVVLGRIQLERYRQSSDPKDLQAARASLRMVNTGALDTAERGKLGMRHPGQLLRVFFNQLEEAQVPGGVVEAAALAVHLM